MKMTRCSIPCLLIVCFIGQLPGGEWHNLAAGFTCPEPVPVANAVRTWSQVKNGKSTASYTCVDGYRLTAGSLTRTCDGSVSRNYTEEPPQCTLDCGQPRDVAVTVSNVTGTLASNVTEYSCKNPYQMHKKYNSTQSCDPVTAQWVAEKGVFCKAKLDLTKATATQQPDLGDASSAQLAVDKNVTTCSETAESSRPSWTVEVSSGEPFDVINIEFVMVLKDPALFNVSLRADMSGGLLDSCGRHNKTKATQVNGTLHGSIFCAGEVKPFGKHLTLLASFDDAGLVNGSLQLCDVKVKGGPHTAACNYPPRIPRLKLVTVEETAFVKMNTVRYECEDQYAPFSGSGNSTCGLDAHWSFPSLVCIDDEVVFETTLAQNPPVVNNRNTMSVVLNLNDPFEILGVFLANVTQDVNVNVTLGNSLQTCDDVNYSDSGVFVTCLYRPVSSKVTMDLPSDIDQSISKIKVFGSGPFKSALECFRSAVGEDYKGMLNYSHGGLQCLAWSDVKLHNFTADDFPDVTVGAAGNRCRNPAMSRRSPWCYVQDIDGPQQQDCDIFLCNQFCKVTEKGTDYQGSKQTTIKGKECQRWSSINQPFVRPLDFPNGTMDHSNCRNPGGSQSTPWCFVKKRAGNSGIEGKLVTDGGKLHYDLCDIPMCPTSINIALIQQSEALTVSAFYDSSTTTWECHAKGAWHSTHDSLVHFMDMVCSTWTSGDTGQPDNHCALCQARSATGSIPGAWTHFIVICDGPASVTPVTTLSTSPLDSVITSDWSDTQMWIETTVENIFWSESASDSELFSIMSTEVLLSTPWSETDEQSTPFSSLSDYVTSPSYWSETIKEAFYSTPLSSVSSEHSEYFSEFSTLSLTKSQSDVSSVVFTTLVQFSPSQTETSPGSDFSIEPSEASDWSSQVTALSTGAASFSIEPSESDSGQPSSAYQLSQEVSMTSSGSSDSILSSATYSQSFSIQSTQSSDLSSNNAVTSTTLMSTITDPNDPVTPVSTNSLPASSSSSEIVTTPASASTVSRLCPQKCSCGTYNQDPYQSSVLENLVSSIRTELSVDASNLSRTLRKKTSASDSRVSAVTIGSFGVVLLISTFGLIAASDILHATRGGCGRGQ